ncbi:MAG: AMP phosphorylase [Candidatus Micrarchaeota archaeon]
MSERFKKLKKQPFKTKVKTPELHCGSFATTKFTAKVIDIKAGQNEIALNEEEAKCLDLGLLDRIKVKARGREAIALVDHSKYYLKPGEIELFSEIASTLNAKSGDVVTIEPSYRPKSLDYIRKKLDNEVLSTGEITEIVKDLMAEKLSNAELAAFMAAVYINELNSEETAALTRAIFETGDSLTFEKGKIIVSEHSIGGVAGDRVSIILVPLLASLGITIPKTCTRAISSAAGTADTMEVFCPVSLSLSEIKNVIKKVNCCLVWGGAVNMAVADDKLIKIRNPLRLDPKSLLLSSILAKKKAEGATHVLLDIPIGRGTKILEVEKARELAQDFQTLGSKLGMKVEIVITDGSEPVLKAIGPALEAIEILKVMKGGDGLLVEKTAIMAGKILKMVRGTTQEEGYRIAMHQLKSGKAYAKFKELIAAQGGDPEITEKDIKVGKIAFDVIADASGKVEHIDNKAISRVCRALGSPIEKSAGMVIHISTGDKVTKGQKLYTLYANSKEKMEFAIEQAKQFPVVEIERIIIDTM